MPLQTREAAYTEFEPLIKSTENNLLTTELPKIKEEVSGKNEKPLLTKLIGNPKEEPKLENALYRVGEHGKTQIENALYRVGENEKSQLENALYRVGEHGKMQIENALNHVGENEKSQLKNALYQTGEDSRITKLKNAAFRPKDNEKEETSSFGNNAPKPDEALSEIKKSGKMTGFGGDNGGVKKTSTDHGKQHNTENITNDNGKITSSKFKEYDASDLIKDMLLPSVDKKDVTDNIRKGDYVSAVGDVARNKIPLFDTAKDAGRAMWKAGSELYLKPKGLDVSADMLEHSLQENPENVVLNDDSEVAKKIKEDKEFLKHVDEVVWKIENKTELSNEDKSHEFKSKDLFFSIHNCQMNIDNIKYNDDGTKDISVHLHDTYDYTKIWTAMSEDGIDVSRIGLGSVANDLGTITSKLDSINPYEVDIYFTIRR